MKRGLIIFFLSIILSNSAFSNGVGIVDASGIYLRLKSSSVKVDVETQISVVTTTQTFVNELGSDKVVKYAFPLSERASAIGLRFYVNGQWYIANIADTPQDTTIPGGTISPNLKTYLGATPLYFSIPGSVKKDSTLIVELKYVEFLPYDMGSVDFNYQNDYRLIQNLFLDLQELEFSLTSSRNIDSLKYLSTHTIDSISHSSNSGYIRVRIQESLATQNYKIKYSLNLTQLGLFAYSNLVPSAQVPDTLGGFLTFIAEPDPGPTVDVIEKVFTLIVDRSGSMMGTKMVQAINAAKFIVEHLNPGDKFNIIDFATEVRSFRNYHSPFIPSTRDSALTYISSLIANGWTNISGAFSTAIPQFTSSSDSVANIIIFFTDGQATIGIQSTSGILAHVDSLVNTTEKKILLFSFGIGLDVNKQLLTLLSKNNDGLADFLGNDELYEKITSFYLKIQNPVLINTQIDFSRTVDEVYPDPLPNLYKGQQMIVSGRYKTSGPITITLSGSAFGSPVSYTYHLSLADSNILNYQFLMKVWAKQKIENMLVQYYSLPPGSPQAEVLKQDIIKLSMAYGVISPFTSFSGGFTGVESEGTNEKEILPHSFQILGNFPNPFNPGTLIRVKVIQKSADVMFFRIYDVLGKLIRSLKIIVNSNGSYEIYWDGKNEFGGIVPTGNYIYVIEYGEQIQASKMTLLK